MTSEMNRSRIIVILLFAITFTLIGWLAPVLYATHVPQSEVIEVHEFTAQNTTTTADEHHICFDRTVHRSGSAKVFTELYLLNGDGQRVEIESNTADRYFQSGNTQVVTPLELPDNLAEGEYKYVLVAKFDMAGGRVTRTFAFHSEPFTVSDGAEPVDSHREAVARCG